MKSHRILNLGAGVQSTTVALMIHKGILPPIEAAIFADVQEEPQDVYRHLDWLIKEVATSFPVLVRTNGKLGDALVTGRTHRKGHTTIPAFCLNERNGQIGVARRQCTGDYKIDVVERTIRREILNLVPRKRWPKGVLCYQLFGLSFDECGRIGRVIRQFEIGNRARKFKPLFPLYDMQMTRGGCLKWLREYGVPHDVPRSACVFCPYKSNAEWQRLKEGPKPDWERAVAIDRLLRVASSKQACGMRNPQFLHRSCIPLEEIDFRSPEARGDQGTLGFMAECEGMCGV